MAEDWLIFKLKRGAAGSGELGDAVMAPFGKKLRAEVAPLAQAAGATASETGVRLSGDAAAAQALAKSLEPKLGAVGIASVRTNEWWDLLEFAAARAPLG